MQFSHGGRVSAPKGGESGGVGDLVAVIELVERGAKDLAAAVERVAAPGSFVVTWAAAAA
jgi:hypothetical protein